MNVIKRPLFMGLFIVGLFGFAPKSAWSANGHGVSAAVNVPLLNRIYAAAQNYIGTSTNGLSGGGANSCAAAIQAIVRKATGRTIGTVGVDDWRKLALSSSNPYGGVVLHPGEEQQAKRGAIIIWPEKEHPVAGHIGVCAIDGCHTTWSNHSDHGSGSVCRNSGSFFASCGSKKSDVINGGITMYAAPNDTFLIWEPAHIP